MIPCLRCARQIVATVVLAFDEQASATTALSLGKKKSTQHQQRHQQLTRAQRHSYMQVKSLDPGNSRFRLAIDDPLSPLIQDPPNYQYRPALQPPNPLIPPPIATNPVANFPPSPPSPPFQPFKKNQYSKSSTIVCPPELFAGWRLTCVGLRCVSCRAREATFFFLSCVRVSVHACRHAPMHLPMARDFLPERTGRYCTYIPAWYGRVQNRCTCTLPSPCGYGQSYHTKGAFKKCSRHVESGYGGGTP